MLSIPISIRVDKVRLRVAFEGVEKNEALEEQLVHQSMLLQVSLQGTARHESPGESDCKF